MPWADNPYNGGLLGHPIAAPSAPQPPAGSASANVVKKATFGVVCAALGVITAVGTNMLMLKLFEWTAGRQLKVIAEAAAASSNSGLSLVPRQPFSAAYPIPFLWLSLGVMGCFTALYHIVVLIWDWLRDIQAFERNLQVVSASRLGRKVTNFSTSVLQDQDSFPPNLRSSYSGNRASGGENGSSFDLLPPTLSMTSSTSSSNGNAGNLSPQVLMSTASVGPVSLLLLLQGILWIFSLNHLSVPLANCLQYSSLLIVPALAGLWLRRERISGFRVLAALVAFLGIFAFFFPEPTATIQDGRSVALILKGGLFASASALALAIYIIAFRAIQPRGPIILTVGFQGLACFALGWPVMALAQKYYFRAIDFEGAELWLPRYGSDWVTVVAHGLSRGLVLICFNSALRYSDPLLVSAAFPCIPALAYLAAAALYAAPGSPFVAVRTAKTVAAAVVCGTFALCALSLIVDARTLKKSYQR